MTPLRPATRLRDEASTARAEFAADVRAGLARRPKRIPSKWFYDARGSELFERICTLPEYYLTRTELSILRRHAGAIAGALGPRPLLVEYGSGSGTKTQLLLAALLDPVGYVPIELSRSALHDSVQRLARAFPHLAVLPVCADFTTAVALPVPARRARRVVVFFPGSTLGNFDAREAVALLARMRRLIGAGGAALIGIDLRKDRTTLEAAYNDAAGITAQFTLNLLARMNRELAADFDLTRFRHRARWNALAGRIETHIVSCDEQQVQVDGRRVRFAAGEAVLVEYSCKYTQAGFERIAARAGLRVERHWSDPDGAFALELLRPA